MKGLKIKVKPIDYGALKSHADSVVADPTHKGSVVIGGTDENGEEYTLTLESDPPSGGGGEDGN